MLGSHAKTFTITSRKEVRWESPGNENRFEDDIVTNETLFQKSLKSKMAKYEFYYGPYQRKGNITSKHQLDSVADQTIKDKLNASTMQEFLSIDTPVTIKVPSHQHNSKG